MRRITIFITALILVSFPMASQAQDPVATGQNVIRSQIEAFLNDDAETAYSFASPGIKQRFPDETRFFAMVKRMYEPVFRPGGFAFSRSKASEDGSVVMQEVLISGLDGRSWSAIYQLIRNEDGDYKINGVQMFPDRKSKGI